ncbi:KilA-N domain-containing protein [Azospirillum sp. CT11-132]|uniref:KilA-N domain-containing protein n=1 Tax=Azospirillum sp. CT11-132 TaxID=3396317 RepID=UPI0039A5F8E4
MSDQLSLDLIEHVHGGEVIRQRARDGYINATAMCRAAGREWSRYRELKATKEFLPALALALGVTEAQLAITTFGTPGGDARNQGTWVHPQVAIDLAQWLSPEFKIKVTRWVMEWMSGAGSPVATRRASFDFMKRYHLNADRVDHGYFSIIGELYVRIHGELEHLGYVLPERGPDGRLLRPDISVGQTFPRWLEENFPGLAGLRKKYPHLLPDGMVVDAWQYHNSVWPQFIEFVTMTWLPYRAIAYFRERDPLAIPFVEQIIARLPSAESYPRLPR